MNFVIGIVVFILVGFVTLLVAIGIGKLLKPIWKAPENHRNKAGLVILGLVEVAATVALFQTVTIYIPSDEIAPFMFSFFMRALIYYGTWAHFTSEHKMELEKAHEGVPKAN